MTGIFDSDKMRIGMMAYALDRPTGGIGRYTIELACALSAHNQDLAFVLLAAGNPGPLADRNTFRAVSLPGCRLLPGLMTVGNGLIPMRARQLNLDIVHDPTGVSPFLFSGGGAHIVVTVHDVFPWVYPATSTLLESLIYRYWLPRILPRSAAVITVSQASKRDIVRFLNVSPAQIRVVREGVGRAYQPISPQRVAAARLRYHMPDHYLLYLGSTREHKNLQGLLSAYDNLQRTGTAPSLVLVGVSPKECHDMLVKTPSTTDLAPNIICLKHVAEADLPSLYTGADFLVRPVLYEGFGLPPLEAMACGTPVVCSNAASLPEVVGDAAITVDPTDVEALAEAMRSVLSDRDLQEDLRQRGLERAAGFTWERTARETVAVYQEVLG